MSLACECFVNSEYFTVHRYRLIDANVIVCCKRKSEVNIYLQYKPAKGVVDINILLWLSTRS